jgi:twitching motility protein PilU
MIGEVRDRETMQQALLHTLTGHLCPDDAAREQQLPCSCRGSSTCSPTMHARDRSDLSIGLRAIISQRLVRNKEGAQQPAAEILLNTSLIAELIKNGEITQIKEAMEQSLYPGSQTFEQALCRLYLDSVITYDEALAGSDSPTNLAWLVNQNSPTARIESAETGDGAAQKPASAGFAKLELDPESSTPADSPGRGDERLAGLRHARPRVRTAREGVAGDP